MVNEEELKVQGHKGNKIINILQQPYPTFDEFWLMRLLIANYKQHIQSNLKNGKIYYERINYFQVNNIFMD